MAHSRRDQNLDDDAALAEAMKQSMLGQSGDTREALVARSHPLDLQYTTPHSQEMAAKIIEMLGVSLEQANMAVEATGGQSLEAAIELCF